MNNLIPCQCLLCASSSKTPICSACLHALAISDVSNSCPRCAAINTQGNLCGGCLNAPPAFDQTLAAFLYIDPLAQLIQAAKFGGRWALLPPLGQLLASRLTLSIRPDCLIALPLHPNRLSERGFNQAIEIALPIARTLGIPLENGHLLRLRDTEHQARLSANARWQNMRGAFQYTGNLNGKNVALIDDVMTSGASLNAAAKALKAAGAAHVQAWVLARTP